MASPVSYEHGFADDDLALWLGYYRRAAKGVRGGKNVTTILSPFGKVQPDAQLTLPESANGRTRLEGGYVVGPPELVVEVSKSSHARRSRS